MAVLLVDVFVAMLGIIYYYYRKNKHARHFSILANTSKEGEISVSNEADGLESATRAPSATRVLIEGFHLSRGNQPLLDFDFSELGLSIPGGKKVLHGVTGSIRHGQVTAVMGPSGAGKTTFLNTLMGKVDSNWKTEGSLQVNGVESKGLSKLKKLIGYVPQEDVMYRELSVWQNLKYSADVRLPRDWDGDQRQRHVNAVLEVLDLVNVRNSPIGDESTRGVSGGQRKRVNIGMELAACPLALFCDEPTSGLDASASLSVVTAVKKVARATGMTVVMVIHQPRVEIWNSLDRVLILAPGGITGYLGPQRFVQRYFEHHFHLRFKPSDNPADIVMDFIAAHGADCAQTWKTDGEEWLTMYASKHRTSDDEFDDAFAESISVSLNASKMLKNSAFHPKNESQMEMITPRENGNGNHNNLHESENIIMGEAPNSQDHVIRGANFFFQMWYAFRRSIKMQYISLPSLILEMGLAVFAGAVIGFSAQMHFQGVAIAPYTTLTPSPELTIVPQKALYIQMAVGIAAASAGVKTFGEGMVIYWREASAGHNRLAFYIAQSLAMIPRIILGGLHFTSFFQVLSQSYNSYGQMLVNVTLIFYAVYGLASIVSMLVPRKDAPLLAAVICVIAAVLNGYVRTIPKQLDYISYAYWSHEAFFSGETAPFKHVFQLNIAANWFHIIRERLSLDYGLMFVIGTVYRLIGMALLLLLNRDKQR